MLTAVILTKNEEVNLDACLKSLSFCDRLLIIDDNSTDNTVKIAKRYKARFIIHLLEGNFSAQRNFALSCTEAGWVLFIDPDERVSPELANEISQATKRNDCTGFYIPRRDVLWGKQLRYGDTGNIRLLRLAKRTAGNWVGKVHETWSVEGRVDTLVRPIFHYPHPSVDDFLKHLNFYSSIRADELKYTGEKPSVTQIIFYPVGKFLYLYFFRLGLLDGTAGFIHAMLMSFYSFLVRGKLYLLHKGIS
jgi:glycosyltransferase involved in cell wall biosynthesis